MGVRFREKSKPCTKCHAIIIVSAQSTKEHYINVSIICGPKNSYSFIELNVGGANNKIRIQIKILHITYGFSF